MNEIIANQKIFKRFLDENATEDDLFYNLDEYTEQVKDMVLKLYFCCYRLNLYKSQTKYILNEALKPFSSKRLIDKEGLW